MQVGGIDNHSSSHQVTGCMHEHHTEHEKTGAMRASSFASSGTPQNTMNPKDGQGLSLLDTLKNTMSKGLGFLGNLWSGDKQADIHQPTVAAAASAVQPDARLSDNPYFTTNSDPGKTKENLTEKIRIRLRDLRGQLMKGFGGRTSHSFAGKKALDSGRQKPREDLRRRSRYKEENLEIDCVLTDDSYLMDSYDRKGEYSKLTTDYKGQDNKSLPPGGRKN